MGNLATIGLLSLLPLVLCGGLTIWRGYVCAPEIDLGKSVSRVPIIAYGIFLLSVLTVTLCAIAVFLGVASDSSSNATFVIAAIVATATTIGVGYWQSDWASARMDRLRLLARQEADEWWKKRKHDSPARIREAVEAVKTQNTPYPERSIVPPASFGSRLCAAWVREYILIAHEQREELERALSRQRYH